MIGYLSGKILDFSEGKVILGVGSPENGFTGYALNVPNSAAYLDIMKQANTEFFVYTHVREDALDLYGFKTRVEKELFLTLLSVTGIGPKGALSIISSTEADELIRGIVEQDRDFLCQIHGIGKKTVERLIIELSEPFRKKMEAGVLFASSGNAASRRAAGASFKDDFSPKDSTLYTDAKAALLGLGYREQEVSTLLKKIVAETSPTRAEDLIRAALQQMV